MNRKQLFAVAALAASLPAQAALITDPNDPRDLAGRGRRHLCATFLRS